MRFEIDNRSAFAATGGGVENDPDRPLVVLLHGAGMDHSVWALQSRWLAYHGWRVLAVDLPGHGRSEGPPLVNIADLADWTIRVLDAAGAARGALVGQSMGALVALEAAARRPDRVASLTLLGAAETMSVHPDLLEAAGFNAHLAVDMVSLWSLGPAATLGHNSVPGLWMLGGVQRLLERAAPGVLHADLSACDAYRGADAAKVSCPTTLIHGERDQMTPLKGARALAARIPGARVVVVPGAGHMAMLERPQATLEALRGALAAGSRAD